MNADKANNVSNNLIFKSIAKSKKNKIRSRKISDKTFRIFFTNNPISP